MKLVDYRRDLRGLAWGILASILAIWVWHAGITRRLELIAYDCMFRLDGAQRVKEDSSDVVVIGITEKCLSRLGAWPWPRRYHAAMVDRLAAYGARVIAFDIIFSEPNKEDDRLLANACHRSGRVILPVCTSREPAAKVASGIVEVDDLTIPAPQLRQAVFTLAHINLNADDRDGIARRVPLFIKYKNDYYPYFGAAVTALYSGRKLQTDSTATRVMLGSENLPVESGGQMAVNFKRKRGCYLYSDVLAGRVSPKAFKNKAVIIGSIGPGLSDVHITPLRAMDGIMIHAAAIDTMIEGRYLHNLPKLLIIALILLCGVLTGLGVLRYRALGGLACLLVLITVFFSAAVLLFIQYNIILDIVPLLLALAGGYTLTLAGYFRLADKVIEGQDLRLSSLYRAGNTSSLTAFNSADVVKMLIAAAQAVVKADVYGLALPDEEGHLVWKIAEGCAPKIIDTVFDAGEGVTGEAFRSCRPIMAIDIRKQQELGCVELEYMGRTVLSVPMVVHSYSVGVLTLVQKRRRRFSSEDLDTISALTCQAAVMLEDVSLQLQTRKAYLGSIEALSMAIDAKDDYTHGHSQAVARNAVAIAERLKLSEREIETIRHAALMHDVGKIGINDYILQKPGSLTSQEYEIMKSHVIHGMEIVKPLDFLGDASLYLLYHHERVDGQGYPEGLQGEAIPLGARIISVADAFDAMTSNRLYRKALDMEEALERLKEGAGTQFDGRIVEIFLEIVNEQKQSSTRIAIRESGRIIEPAP
ncbi:MAG: CHASE2 domain-containing protein [bacterium]|jgi:HD-GYP domain-containing protein (c-di-GMP phosphodiesterase class II)/CHASE2 domain-containing sensor protein|nr:CHASE2 domain-containing protein [bacterium]MDD4152166.1 CHASE2 domain-containing protein [bacterium]